MADRRISTGTLTDIADAIRSKTGKSALITPQEMASEIESISTGGVSPWELIVDYTSEEVAQIVEAEIPQEYQSENVYKVQISCQFSGTEYPYFGMNGGNSSYEGAVPKNTSITCVGYIVKVGRNGDKYAISISATKYTAQNDPTFAKSVRVKSYYENAIKAGCNIKVWRLVE